MVQSKRRLLYIREKNRSHKTKNPLFHLLPCHEMLIIVLNCLYIWNIIKYFLNINLKVKSLNYFHEFRLLLSWNGLFQLPSPFHAQWTRPVLLKSKKFEMDLGRLAPASEVAEGHSTYLTILKRTWSADSKMVRLVLPRLYSKVWPMLSIFDSNKQKTPLEISVVFDRWAAVL
jgi:hypothetical protein